MNFDTLLAIFRLTHILQRVSRTIFVPGEDRRENDVEHQYQLALIAWYVIETDKLPLDLNLVIRYALVHDFVEVYAGDTHFFGDRSGKEEREHAAAQRLIAEHPEFASLHETIQAYEARVDAESQFVYALDKVIPVINIYLDGGRAWRELNISLDMLSLNKERIVNVPEVRKILDEMLVRLRAEEPNLFPQKEHTAV